MSQPHGGHGHKDDSPLVKMMVSMSGAAAPEHETSPPGAEEVSVKAGHEPDRFDVKGILYVPGLVAVVLVLTYVCVQVIFSAIRNPAAPDGTNPQVTALNDNSFNARAGRISSTDPEPVEKRPGTAVPQPRLEFIREQAGGRGKDDPVFYRSERGMQDRNSPEIRPEDLRADNYVDPATGKKVLAEYGYVGDKTKNVIRLPIDEAIHMVEHGQLKLPVRKDPVKLAATTDGSAKISNGGKVAPAGPAVGEPTPHKEPGKKHDH